MSQSHRQNYGFGPFCTPLRATNRREVESRGSGPESSEAQQKFAGAKAISSDMFFGREVDTEVSALGRDTAGDR